MLSNTDLILNYKQDLTAVKKLFQDAKRDKHEFASGRVELLDNYDVAVITGLKVVAGGIDTVTYKGRSLSLLAYLETILQGDTNGFLYDVLGIDTTNYQKYAQRGAEHALDILSYPVKQPKEMRRAFRNVKGSKQVLEAIWLEALVNPLKYKPVKETPKGVVQPLALSQIHGQLDSRLRKHLNQDELGNIINILIVAGSLERVGLDKMTYNQTHWIKDHYPDLTRCPTFYVCTTHLEKCNWERVATLTEKTKLTPDAVRALYGDEVADKMLPITGQPNHKRLELTHGQVTKMKELMDSHEVTTYEELVTVMLKADFGVLRHVAPVIDEGNLKKHVNAFEVLGYFKARGIKSMTASKARGKGYQIPKEIHGRSKVYVK